MMYIRLLLKYSVKGAKLIGLRTTSRTYKLNPNVLTSPETPNILFISFSTDE